MTDSDRVARIRAYLEQYRDTYDREALRERLIADGHNSQDIDLAMAQVYGFQASPQAAPTYDQRPPDNSTQFALIIIGTILLNLLLFCGTFIVGINTESLYPALAVWIGGGLVPIAAEGAAAWALRRRNRTVSRGLMWGAIGSFIVYLMVALLFGICIALISSVGG